MTYFDVVFDGPPSHESGRFIEVENERGESIRIGEWVQDGDLWRLRIQYPSNDPCLDCGLREAEIAHDPEYHEFHQYRRARSTQHTL